MTFRYPATADWTLIKSHTAGNFDWLLGPTNLSVEFMRLATGGLTLDGLEHRVRTDPHNDAGFHVESVATVTLGGLTGKQMLMRADFAQESQIDTAATRARRRTWILAFVRKGSYFYEVFLAGDASHETDDRALMDRFVASVVLI